MLTPPFALEYLRQSIKDETGEELYDIDDIGDIVTRMNVDTRETVVELVYNIQQCDDDLDELSTSLVSLRDQLRIHNKKYDEFFTLKKELKQELDVLVSLKATEKAKALNKADSINDLINSNTNSTEIEEKNKEIQKVEKSIKDIDDIIGSLENKIGKYEDRHSVIEDMKMNALDEAILHVKDLLIIPQTDNFVRQPELNNEWNETKAKLAAHLVDNIKIPIQFHVGSKGNSLPKLQQVIQYLDSYIGHPGGQEDWNATTIAELVSLYIIVEDRGQPDETRVASLQELVNLLLKYEVVDQGEAVTVLNRMAERLII